jgi:hypothetical protein
LVLRHQAGERSLYLKKKYQVEEKNQLVLRHNNIIMSPSLRVMHRLNQSLRRRHQDPNQRQLFVDLLLSRRVSMSVVVLET